MTTIEIARRMARLGETQEALKAYSLVLNDDLAPEELLEAAAYTLDNGGDYKLSYTTFVQLYNAGQFREEILPLLTTAFYEPNVKLLKGRYERNIKLLQKYPYLFRKDFLPFDELPLIFFPYDDHGGYVPFDTAASEFRGFVNVKDPVVSRNFFKDLEKPILASDVYSQYELEYLHDNVRPSEWVGRENHIYLHYTDWAEFCSWLTVLSVKPLLEDGKAKIVFLIGDELAQYPIDFKERFGIDYSQCPVEPIHIREINKLIWHTQFSSDNGGDFFNEIFDGHPNLIYISSVLFETYEESIKTRANFVESIKRQIRNTPGLKVEKAHHMLRELIELPSPTDKDYLIAIYYTNNLVKQSADPSARIVPALLLQPHFHSPRYVLSERENGAVSVYSDAFDQICKSGLLDQFKYVKTFTPIRRITTSYAATMRTLVINSRKENKSIENNIVFRVTNRSFMRDPDERLYRDSVVVRFEDGKLNPRATFSRLAAFLDIPYTESMTYCSESGVKDVQTEVGNVIGFDPATVYRTYGEYANDIERAYIEFLLRDAYAFYGYDFQYYDGTPVDEKRIEDWVDGFTTFNAYLRENWQNIGDEKIKKMIADLPEDLNYRITGNGLESMVDNMMRHYRNAQLDAARLLLKKPRFVNKRGQPLQMIPLLEPDPDLLDQPLYH